MKIIVAFWINWLVNECTELMQQSVNYGIYNLSNKFILCWVGLYNIKPVSIRFFNISFIAKLWSWCYYRGSFKLSAWCSSIAISNFINKEASHEHTYVGSLGAPLSLRLIKNHYTSHASKKQLSSISGLKSWTFTLYYYFYTLILYILDQLTKVDSKCSIFETATNSQLNC